MAGMSIRGSLKYDGFVLPGSLTMYAMPQNDGLYSTNLGYRRYEPRLLVRTIRIHVWIENPKGRQ